jgi:hypothetical protein
MNKKFKKTFPKTTDTFIKKVEKQVLYMVISFDTVNAVETKGWFKEEISSGTVKYFIWNFCITMMIVVRKYCYVNLQTK